MAEEDRDVIPAKIIDIMYILLKAGWNINGPVDHLGKTVLHQAANFATGAHKWDLEVKKIVTEFLCENEAHVKKANEEVRTPFDVGLGSENQDKASLSSGHAGSKGRRYNEVALAELM